jgi:3'-5' exoribonuclease 1
VQWDKAERAYTITDKFHSYVRPTWRPRLAQFCRDLTGITQEKIDASPTYSEVEFQLFSFLKQRGLLVNPWIPDSTQGGSAEEDARIPPWQRNRFRVREGVAWVTHGPADLQVFVPKQAYISSGEDIKPAPSTDAAEGGEMSSVNRPPLWFRGPVLEIRKSIAMLEFLGLRRPDASARPSVRDISIEGLLEQLSIGPFQGRLHSGIDDSLNIARIVIELGNRIRDANFGVEVPTDLIRSNKVRQRFPAATSGVYSQHGGKGGRSAQKARKADILGAEGGCLVPNLDTSRVGDKKWPWAGKTPGSIVWNHPPDPTMLPGSQNNTLSEGGPSEQKS